MFIFRYQIFDFIQLMRREPVIAGERYRGDPELCLTAGPGHMDMRRLVSFVGVKQELVAASRNLDRWHGIKIAITS
jgi:hypothetical protein